jgi:hypothetical protein
LILTNSALNIGGAEKKGRSFNREGRKRRRRKGGIEAER